MEKEQVPGEGIIGQKFLNFLIINKIKVLELDIFWYFRLKIE